MKQTDAIGSIKPEALWRVDYDFPNGKHASHMFEDKSVAERFLDNLEYYPNGKITNIELSCYRNEPNYYQSK